MPDLRAFPSGTLFMTQRSAPKRHVPDQHTYYCDIDTHSRYTVSQDTTDYELSHPSPYSLQILYFTTPRVTHSSRHGNSEATSRSLGWSSLSGETPGNSLPVPLFNLTFRSPVHASHTVTTPLSARARIDPCEDTVTARTSSGPKSEPAWGSGARH